MNNKYMILQKPKLKVNLLAGDGTWDVVIDRKTYKIDIFFEALFASYIYEGYRPYTEDVRCSMADRYNKNITPEQAEKFVRIFQEAHEVIKIDDSELQDIQLLNTEEGCMLPFEHTLFALPKEDEKWMVKFFLENPLKGMDVCREFFEHYLDSHHVVLNPKLDVEIEAFGLTDSFRRIHGLKQVRLTKKNKKWYERCFPPVVVIPLVIVLVFIMPLVGIMVIDDSNSAISLILFGIFYLALGVVVYAYLSLK